MEKYREFMSLTNDEIKVIINDMFKPVKIGKITKDKHCEEIRVEIVTKWYSKNDKGETEEELITDEITLFEYDIVADFEIFENDIKLYKQYLFAKGINELYKDNPYLKDKLENNNGKIILKK